MTYPLISTRVILHTPFFNVFAKNVMNKLPKTKCPTCGKPNTWQPDNQFRPFCSDRCKLIDLGEWASESRKIAGEAVDPNAVSGEDLED